MSKLARTPAPLCSPIGTAVILDFDYLGIIYEVRDFSPSQVWIYGLKEPPKRSFSVLLHLSNCFIECRAFSIQDCESRGANWVVRFEHLHPPSFLRQPPQSFHAPQPEGMGSQTKRPAVLVADGQPLPSKLIHLRKSS